MKKKKISGYAFDGGGSSSKIMKGKLLSKLRYKTGFKIIPGTLNIKLDDEVDIELDTFKCCGERYFIGKHFIRVNGVPVYIFRAPRGSRKKDDIEVISDKKLREHLKIDNNSELCVKL